MSSPDRPEGIAPSRVLTGRRRRALVQVTAFVRKELLSVMRQPVLLAVLVAGPFALLLLFAISYDLRQTVLRTVFVGPEDSPFEEATERFAGDLDDYVTNTGYTTDLVAAERQLSSGEVDLIVVFPPEPSETVLGGEQAVITVLHDKLDPIQQSAVNVTAQVAVQELNAMALEQVVGDLQSSLRPFQENLDHIDGQLDELDAALASGDQAEADRLASSLSDSSGGLQSSLDASRAVRQALGGSENPEASEQLDQLEGAVDELEAATSGLDESTADEADVDQAQTALDQVRERSDTALTLDPSIAVRPLTSDSENLLREEVTLNDFFAPAAIALLVQHMSLTFAALGLVRDRGLGLFELFRVGAVRAGHILLGKYLAHLVLNLSVTFALLLAVVTLLDVPFRGSVGWLVLGAVLLVSSSIAAGMILALLARSDSQAIQYAMLTLLAGLFFGGFLLELDALRYPARAVSFVLPVTFGTDLLRDVLLRGIQPAFRDLAGLSATALVYGSIAWILMARRLRLR